MTDDIKDLKDAEQEEPERDGSSSASWLPGLGLIIIGVIFLVSNLTDFELRNWWALFILIPAFGALGNFWRAWRAEGRIGHDARGSLIGAMILFFIAAVFLFGWSWAAVWPFFLIIAGVGALLSALLE